LSLLDWQSSSPLFALSKILIERSERQLNSFLAPFMCVDPILSSVFIRTLEGKHISRTKCLQHLIVFNRLKLLLLVNIVVCLLLSLFLPFLGINILLSFAQNNKKNFFLSYSHCMREWRIKLVLCFSWHRSKSYEQICSAQANIFCRHFS
jgi:hypothetical protein